MLTTDDRLGDYEFRSSPESCSDQSFSTDYMEVGSSDEDFLTQLSSDLDIPLLLNPGEDEMNILNSFFDKSPDEILSEVLSPPMSLKEDDSSSHSDEIEIKACDIPLDRKESSVIKVETPNVASSQPIFNGENVNNIKFERATPKPEVVTYTLDIEDEKPEIKQDLKPIVFKQNFTVPTTKTIPIMPKYKFPLPLCTATTIPKVVLVDKRPVANLNLISTKSVSVQPMIMKSTSTTIPGQNIALPNRLNIDSSAMKRQQRKIKNRESACLSRKRKKDYLNSLEDQVKQLVTENETLKKENDELKDRLAQYEGSSTFGSAFRTKSVSHSFVLCAFLLVVGVNVDFISNPFASKNQLMKRNEISTIPDYRGRSLLWTPDDEPTRNKSTDFLPLSMCPAAVNQTESARLALELERWIGVPSKPKINKSDVSKLSKVATVKSKVRTRRRKPKPDSSLVMLGPRAETKNEIQVFTPNPEQLYSEFFEAINRQDDTFYVVSFSHHHMLLPALYHNKTRRPKMSLIMPSLPSTDNSTKPLFPLMQIDCEVLDTKLLHIKYGSIPQQYRNDNNTMKEGPSREADGSNSSSSSTPKYYKKQYKPYFIKKASLKPEEDFFNIP